MADSDPNPNPQPIPDGDPLASIPPLTTLPAVSEHDRIAALRLIADSVAQQRQTAAKAVIFHPVVLAGLAAVMGIVYQLLYRDRGDLAIVFTTWAGCVMAGLVALRGLTGGYLELAERTGTWGWLDSGRGERDGEDLVIVTRFGEEVIGALVLRPSSTSTRDENEDPEKRRRGGRRSARTVGLIRAWTVLRRYRRKGVGMALLEEAVSICRERKWEGPVFDGKHANSARLLPWMFDLGIERTERWAKRVLEGVI